jgi:hypothetical protein
VLAASFRDVHPMSIAILGPTTMRHDWRGSGMALDTKGPSLDDVYQDRNLVVQLAAILAQRLGFQVWVGVDKDEPDWPVIYIDLPTGQVSWHIPQHELIAKLNPSEEKWDGHSPEEKQQRIREFLATGG